MILTLSLDYKKPPMGEDKQPVQGAVLSKLIITRLVETKYPQAIPKTESRMWAKIQDSFDEKSLDSITVDGSQFDFLCDVLNGDLPPAFSSWLETLRDEFDTVKQANKKEADSGEKLKAVAK